MGFPIAARFAHPDAGYDAEQERAARLLEPGRVYIVKRLEVGRSDSELTVWLDGAQGPAATFSTVLFEPAATPGDRDDDEEAEEPPMSTVGDLLGYLATQPMDRRVVLQKDAEGNGYSPLAEAGEALYEPDSTWSGEVYPTPEDKAAWVASGAWTQADADERHEPDERVVVLGPVN